MHGFEYRPPTVLGDEYQVFVLLVKNNAQLVHIYVCLEGERLSIHHSILVGIENHLRIGGSQYLLVHSRFVVNTVGS